MIFKSVFFACLTGLLAYGYIPPYSMIMSRTADNHGHGVFVIEQDVVYRDSTDPKNTQSLRETWTVLDENRMKVAFQGLGPLKDQIKGIFLYEGPHRLATEATGTHKVRLGDDWLEPFFHFRYSKTIKSRMIQMKMAPPESLREHPTLPIDKPPVDIPEPFVQLTRQNGIVAWGIARSFDGPDLPGVWVQQDGFVITKVRSPDKSTVEASDYEKFDNGLYFPRQRTYNWDGKSVTVTVRSVKALGTVKSKDIWSTSQLTPGVLGGSDILRDFYARFR